MKNDSLLQLMDEYGIFILLLSRQNSSRVREKVSRPFYQNKSLFEIKLDQLNKAGFEERTLIASDIKPDDKRFSFYIHRPFEDLVDNSVPFSKVLMNIYENIDTKYQQLKIKHILITYPTSPLFSDVHYKSALWSYYKNVILGEYDSFIAGELKRGFFWQDQKPLYEANSNHLYTQDIKPMFECNNALWGGKYDVLKEKKYFIGDKPYLYHSSKTASIDIDTQEDFDFAQVLYAAVQEGKLSAYY